MLATQWCNRTGHFVCHLYIFLSSLIIYVLPLSRTAFELRVTGGRGFPRLPTSDRESRELVLSRFTLYAYATYPFSTAAGGTLADHRGSPHLSELWSDGRGECPVAAGSSTCSRTSLQDTTLGKSPHRIGLTALIGCSVGTFRDELFGVWNVEFGVRDLAVIWWIWDFGCGILQFSNIFGILDLGCGIWQLCNGDGIWDLAVGRWVVGFRISDLGWRMKEYGVKWWIFFRLDLGCGISTWDLGLWMLYLWLGFQTWYLGFGTWDEWFMDLGLGAWGLGFRVCDLEFMVRDLGWRMTDYAVMWWI